MSAPDLFEKCVEVLAKDPEVDAIVATFCVLVGSDVDRIANALSAVRGVREIPVVVARTGSQSLAPEADKLFKAAKLPVFPTPERAVRALQSLRIATKPTHNVERKPLCNPLATPADKATEDQLKAALASAGVPVPLSVVVENIDDAIAAVAKVGGRSVMKAVIPGLLHKSEAGGVALDINSDKAGETYQRLSHLGPDKNESNKVLVETFVPKGVETLVGITSSSLGKVLTIGVGGILTEVISDVSVRLLPVDSKIVNEMIDETRLAILFSGVRGAAASNRDAFVDTVLRITDAVIDWPSGCELDINPLTVLPDGAWVLDSAYSPAAKSSERSTH
jgi:acyl-CoA synthetase (NDP forming)